MRAIVNYRSVREGSGMALIALMLGVVFAWLIETGGCWCADKVGHQARREQLRTVGNRVGFAAVLILFVAAITILALGIYGRYTGHLGAWPVRAIYFVTLPDSLGAILGFLLGALLFWRRADLRQVPGYLMAALRASAPEPPAKPAAPDAPEPTDRAKDTYPWLTGIVGISAVTLVAIIALVIFFPGILTRVESIKVAGIEARFAASTSHTVNVTAQANTAPFVTNYVLDKWSSVDKSFASLAEPVRRKFLEKAKATPAQVKDSDEKMRWTLSFLKAFAVPLSYVMSCYSSDFRARETAVQGMAVPVANDWARFAIRVLRSTKEKLKDPKLQAAREQEFKQAFETLQRDLYKFIEHVDADLFKRQSQCGLSSTQTPYGRDAGGKSADDMRRNEAYFQGKEQIKLVTDLDKHLAQIFSNGYVIAFMADMILFTQTPEQAIEFMNVANEFLDRSDDAITGQINFYYSRETTQYQADNWKFDDWISDVTQARALSERIAATVGGSDKAATPQPAALLEHYYRGLIAHLVNRSIYGHVREWLQGRHLSPLELIEAETLAKQLSAWLETESAAALLHSTTEISALTRAITIANSYDTLALYELMAGESDSTLTKDRCGRGWALLNTSKRVWDVLRSALASDDSYRAAITEFNAHQNMYVNACPS
jgi:hypothetical protein